MPSQLQTIHLSLSIAAPILSRCAAPIRTILVRIQWAAPSMRLWSKGMTGGLKLMLRIKRRGLGEIAVPAGWRRILATRHRLAS